MVKRYTPFVFLIGILLLVSCQEEVIVPTSDVDFRSSGDSLFVIDDIGYEMQFALSKELLAMQHAEVLFNEVTGRIEINAGDQFVIYLSQEVLDLERFKLGLREEPLFDYVFYDEGDRSLTFEAILPGGSPRYWHYVSVFDLNGITYTARSAPEGIFTQQHIQWMKSCISSMRSVD